MAYAALVKQSTKPVDNSVCNMLIDPVSGHCAGLCYKLIVFSPTIIKPYKTTTYKVNSLLSCY